VNNNKPIDIIFDHAGTSFGCVKPSIGAIPNEYGTWLYGRDGWCDGDKVQSLFFDVTKEMEFGKNNNNSIAYYGYYNGATPDPTSNPGYIDLYSYLVLYQ